MGDFDLKGDYVNVHQWMAENRNLKDKIMTMSKDFFNLKKEVGDLKLEIERIKKHDSLDSDPVDFY